MRDYPAKLLLFGEHILLLGASALATPIPYYHGQLLFDSRGKKRDSLQQKLWSWAQSPQLAAVPGIEAKSFQTALLNGLVFQSNIPIGYGLGSSGALCAAVYDHFCTAKSFSLPELKTILSGMESFFHGSSSGIDPLTSYINKPLIISNTQEVTEANPAPWASEKPQIFLMDSGLPRKSETMISWFKEQCRQVDFQKWLDAHYLPTSDTCLNAWLQADVPTFWDALENLSRIQMAQLQFLIPYTMKSFWEEGLEKREFFLKICGAGGGGFVLGFARNKNILESLTERHTHGHSVVKINV